MFPPCRRLFIGALLLLAAPECQQAEVGEVEAWKGSSSLADFVNNLIDQMNDVKVEMLNMSIVDAYVDTILKYWPALNFVDCGQLDWPDELCQGIEGEGGKEGWVGGGGGGEGGGGGVAFLEGDTLWI